jgi:hypothetical protein
MKNFPIKRVILSSILLGSSQVSWAACDQTLSPGANLASAISNAASGSTICLNSGNYGTVSLSNIAKTSDVNVQSVSGRVATINPIISGTQHVKFQNLTIAGADIKQSRYISILSSTFTSQMRVIGSGSSSTLANILIDGNTFDGLKYGGMGEGRLQLYDAGGVTVSNNHFGKAGESDGIQWGGYGGTVGPGNVFEGLIQGSYSAHVDAIQEYGQVDHHTIIGNYFNNNTMYIGAYDGGKNITVTHNVFGPGDSNTSGQPIQFGSIQGLTFTHNTVKGSYNVAQGAKSGMPANTNATYQNNIFHGSIISDSGDQPGCASGCTYDHNLFSLSEKARGTNSIVGTPTYTGGAAPSTWAGYPLTSSSLGYQAGTDSKDMGSNLFGGGAVLPIASIAAPSNLRIQ